MPAEVRVQRTSSLPRMPHRSICRINHEHLRSRQRQQINKNTSFFVFFLLLPVLYLETVVFVSANVKCDVVMSWMRKDLIRTSECVRTRRLPTKSTLSIAQESSLSFFVHSLQQRQRYQLSHRTVQWCRHDRQLAQRGSRTSCECSMDQHPEADQSKVLEEKISK